MIGKSGSLRVLVVLAVLSFLALAASCSKDTRHHSEADGGDADTDTDTDSDSDADTDAGADASTDTDTDSDTGEWEWMTVSEEDPFSGGWFLLGVGGTGTSDVVVGGVLWDHCMVRFDGMSWIEVDLIGCEPSLGIGTFCSSQGSGTLWAAPTYSPQDQWPILRRQDGVWNLAPQPAWWLDSYEVGMGGGEQSFACLSDDSVVTMVHDHPGDTAWLMIFDGVEWQIVHEFLLEETIGAIYGSTESSIAIFNIPSSTGLFFNGTDFEPMTIVMPDDIDPASVMVLDLAGSESQGYYAVGYWHTLGVPYETGFVWRSNDLQAWENVDDVPNPDPSLFTRGFHGVDISEDGKVYVVGTQSDALDDGADLGDHLSVVLKYDGSTWAEEEVPPMPTADLGKEWWTEFYGVWCTGNHVYVVGGGAPDGYGRPVVLHYVPPTDL